MTLVLCFAFIGLNAQTYSYRSTEFAYKYVNDYGKWTDWSDWERSNILITINFNTDIVKIYSPKTQTYHITEFVRNYTDNSGGQQVEFRFVDQDYDRGTMRLRIESNGNSQIYIDFSNLMWVYNVVRR